MWSNLNSVKGTEKDLKGSVIFEELTATLCATTPEGGESKIAFKAAPSTGCAKLVVTL